MFQFQLHRSLNSSMKKQQNEPDQINQNKSIVLMEFKKSKKFKKISKKEMKYKLTIIYIYFAICSTLGMEKHHHLSPLQSPLKFFPVSDKQIQSSLHKIKTISNSLHKHINQSSSAIMERIKKHSHARKNSTVRKNKSKCETEGQQSTKKRQMENQSVSKQTLRKRKNPKSQHQLQVKTHHQLSTNLNNSMNNKLKLLNSKNQQQCMTLKSSGDKGIPQRQLFHSTCFSRNIENDMDLHISEDFVRSSAGQGYGRNYECEYGLGQMKNLMSDICSRAKQSQRIQSIEKPSLLNTILDRTRAVLQLYSKHCMQLQKQCKFYKGQLQKANIKLEENLQKSRTNRKSNSKNRQSCKVKGNTKHERNKNNINMSKNSNNQINNGCTNGTQNTLTNSGHYIKQYKDSIRSTFTHSHYKYDKI